MALKAAELWQRALVGESISVEDLQHMLWANVAEDLHLDWKGGALLADANVESLQKAVSGFANAEGGVLVIGANGGDVKEDKWCLTPGPARVKKVDASEWIHQQLSALRPGLRPAPRVTQVAEGVFVIAVSRAEQLVPVLRGDKMTYYLRMHGCTCEIPAYLHADLMLGRRQRPVLEVRQPTLTLDSDVHPPENRGAHSNTLYPRRIGGNWGADLGFVVSNDSLAWADAVTCGTTTLWPAPPNGAAMAPLAEALHPYIRCTRGPYTALRHLRQEYEHTLAPLAETSLSVRLAFPPPPPACLDLLTADPDNGGLVTSRKGSSRWRFCARLAVHLVSRTSPPEWFQITLTYDEKARPMNDLLTVTRVEPPVQVDLWAERLQPDGTWVEVAGWGARR